MYSSPNPYVTVLRAEHGFVYGDPMIPIPWYIKVPLSIALNALLNFLQSKGVDPAVIQKVHDVLAFLGLLGGAHVDTDRFEKVHPHCSGVACPPDLVGG